MSNQHRHKKQIQSDSLAEGDIYGVISGSSSTLYLVYGGSRRRPHGRQRNVGRRVPQASLVRVTERWTSDANG